MAKKVKTIKCPKCFKTRTEKKHYAHLDKGQCPIAKKKEEIAKLSE